MQPHTGISLTSGAPFRTLNQVRLQPARLLGDGHCTNLPCLHRTLAWKSGKSIPPWRAVV